MSLKKKAITGLFWTFTQQFSVQGISILVGIILARILMPSAFGLIGMMALFISLGNKLLDGGMTSSLIRTQNPDQNDYSTVFIINLLFSIAAYLIVFFCAPFIAEFYKQPVLKPLIRVYTLSFIITAFVSVQTTKLSKEMRFKEQMLMQLPSTIIGGILGIFLAYMGMGVWSLVWMYLTQSTLFTIQHWIFSGWLPKLFIDKGKLKYHLQFGYKLTISGLIESLYVNIYSVLIGKFFSPSQLGYYTQANNLQSLPVNNISAALSKVTFPLFAELKDDDEKLRMAYRKLLLQVIFWIAPFMTLAILVAKPLFLVILTSKWLPAVPYFQILCIAGILYPIHVYNLNILNVKGRSDLFLRLEIVKKTFITIGLVIAVFFGIYGLLILQIIVSIFALWVNTHYTGKFLNYSGKQQLRDVLPSIIISFSIGACLWILNIFILSKFNLPSLLVVSILAIIYFILYYLISYFLKISALQDFKQLILKR